MRRMLLALAAVVGLASLADANWGTPPPAQAPAPSANMYGWNPALKKWLWWKKDACGPTGCGAGYSHGGGYGGSGGYGGQPQGTLVFPQHPYVRSPRDFFMWGN